MSTRQKTCAQQMFSTSIEHKQFSSIIDGSIDGKNL